MMRMLNVMPRSDVAFRPQTRLLDSFFSNRVIPAASLDEFDWMPASDIAETETEYHVTMELPGIDMKELNICFSEGLLTINGVKTKPVSIGESCYCSERYYGPFHRDFRIPGKVDAEKIDANYKEGILIVRLTKSGESVVKKIKIH